MLALCPDSPTWEIEDRASDPSAGNPSNPQPKQSHVTSQRFNSELEVDEGEAVVSCQAHIPLPSENLTSEQAAAVRAALAPEDLVIEVRLAAFDPYTGDGDFLGLVAQTTSNVRPPTVAERLGDFLAIVSLEMVDSRSSARAKTERFRLIVEETVRASFHDIDAAEVLVVRQKWRDQLERCKRENRHLMAENRRFRAELRAGWAAA